MKKNIVIALIAILFHAPIAAQEKLMEKQTKSHPMIGYLVDKMCGERMIMTDIKKSDAKAARHTKECALDEACSAEGYGLVTSGTFYKFDDSGDVKAKEFLKATKKEHNIKVEVVGTMNDDKLVVESVKEFITIPTKHLKKK